MTRPSRPDLRIYANLDALSQAAAEGVVALAERAIEESGRFTIALSGGNTPRGLYQLLAGKYRALIPWRQVEVFWGDERYVPPEDPRSNYRMAREALLDQVPIPGENVHAVPTLLPDIEEAAEAYEGVVMDHFQGSWPRFDLILLGLGADGHTASLFPHNAALEEEARVVTAVRAEAEPPLRLTLTLPAINHAAAVHFLAAGEQKARAVRGALAEGADPKACPAAAVRPTEGELVWLVDQQAIARR
jgi:6-phosphogluconolactonase